MPYQAQSSDDLPPAFLARPCRRLVKLIAMRSYINERLIALAVWSSAAVALVTINV
jgi:hypothetical protein